MAKESHLGRDWDSHAIDVPTHERRSGFACAKVGISLDRVVSRAHKKWMGEGTSGRMRHYHDWYNYESRKTTPWEGFWMTVFTVALCAGYPLAFAALFRYGIPLLSKLW